MHWHTQSEERKLKCRRDKVEVFRFTLGLRKEYGVLASKD